ncbi:hypothetical protein G7B40_029330 [Aetokthonos hydrillicola Thurmond2011]|jgi:hypothetical protein|uniref:Uncharacterized protein n=1 Tax=Aetokthonos hydrillicola Thurmond2011 TaxID=2712845 RepID=A0AAP5IBU2_9CYAN|nr:hypothetical protein [Aetokthonos hydrillicola]MBO3457154.1 hypothetical protein [Aetokthonos hydrillicola CCALA 1050]MBW4587504.1 hypothetical protein [Aetokthonos hydrillicola CCALA 1050]MDR9898631.1 hypothetical protein [Aetokthonos hydrillicola Thurmond2011]
MTSRFITSKDFEDHKGLQQRLMNLPESEQFDEINSLLDRNFVIGLQFANAILKDKKYFELLLQRGLEKANASEIELWLKYLVPRIGFRRIIAILSNKLSQEPTQVAKASYWLPKFLPKGNEQAARLLKNLLNQEKQMLGEEYKVVNPSGQVYKLILRIKSTGEFAVFVGYQLGSKGSRIIVEILDSQNLSPTGGVRQVSPGDIEILDPQPYDD